jgi:putative ABC transport system permease protein
VGVVKDTKYRDLRADFSPIVFLPFSQQKEPDAYMNVIARSDVSLTALTNSIKRTLADIDPAISIEFQVFERQIGESLLQERLMALLAGFFGILAGLLAMIGLYGVIAYMVNSRRNEIGIRMALGAGRRNVIGLVLREATLLLSIGLVAGILLTVAAGKTASTMLFGLKPSDPLTIGAAVAALTIIGLLASYIPARRAATVDPMDVLRAE